MIECLPHTVIIWLPVLNSKINVPLQLDPFIVLSLRSLLLLFSLPCLWNRKNPNGFHLTGLWSCQTQDLFGHFSPAYSHWRDKELKVPRTVNAVHCVKIVSQYLSVIAALIWLSETKQAKVAPVYLGWCHSWVYFIFHSAGGLFLSLQLKPFRG